MPKELVNLAKFSTKVVQALPDFLDTTVNHRLKQVAHKFSYGKNLSQSVDPSVSKAVTRNYLNRITHSNQPSPLAVDSFNRSFDASLPFIEPKMAPLSSRPNL